MPLWLWVFIFGSGAAVDVDRAEEAGGGGSNGSESEDGGDEVAEEGFAEECCWTNEGDEPAEGWEFAAEVVKMNPV